MSDGGKGSVPRRRLSSNFRGIVPNGLPVEYLSEQCSGFLPDFFPAAKKQVREPSTEQAVQNSRQRTRNRSNASCECSLPRLRASSRSGTMHLRPGLCRSLPAMGASSEKRERSGKGRRRPSSAKAAVTGFQSSGSAPSEPVDPLMLGQAAHDQEPFPNRFEERLGRCFAFARLLTSVGRIVASGRSAWVCRSRGSKQKTVSREFSSVCRS
jgi:hypothetical protein